MNSVVGNSSNMEETLFSSEYSQEATLFSSIYLYISILLVYVLVLSINSLYMWCCSMMNPPTNSTSLLLTKRNVDHAKAIGCRLVFLALAVGLCVVGYRWSGLRLFGEDSPKRNPQTAFRHHLTKVGQYFGTAWRESQTCRHKPQNWKLQPIDESTRSVQSLQPFTPYWKVIHQRLKQLEVQSQYSPCDTSQCTILKKGQRICVQCIEYFFHLCHVIPTMLFNILSLTCKLVGVYLVFIGLIILIRLVTFGDLALHHTVPTGAAPVTPSPSIPLTFEHNFRILVAP